MKKKKNTASPQFENMLKKKKKLYVKLYHNSNKKNSI